MTATSTAGERRYLPTLAELVDRLSICRLKSIFNPTKRAEYDAEVALITNDIDVLLKGTRVDAAFIHASMMIMLANRAIWENEAAIRNGETSLSDADTLARLRFTHSVNGVRNQAKNVIAAWTGERVDHKTDCLAADLPDAFGNWRIFA